MSQTNFRDPVVSTSIVRTGTGNGSVSVDKLTHFTVAQTYTLTCIAKSPDTIFSVSGSLDGPVGIASVGIQFFDEDLKVFLTITQGSTVFEVGDQFVFSVINGTDLNQDNIDSYDEKPQKNFGAGIKGQAIGDHSLRYSSAAVQAYKHIQDVLFKAVVAGVTGNAVQLQYLNPVPGVQSHGFQQGILYTSVAANAAANGLTVSLLQSISPVKAEITIQNVNFQAITAGAAGNSITVRLTTGATAGSEVVSVTGNAITVQIASGVTTPAQIVSKVNAHPVASTLVFAKVTPAPSTTPQTAPVAATNLAGGVTGSGQAGFEVVTVVGQAISIRCENGVSTVAQIKAAFDASSAATALATSSLTVASSTLITTPDGPAPFTGGADPYGYAGSETVQVTGSLIKVYIEPGVTSAARIKTVVDASSPAAALVSTAILGDGAELQNGPMSATNLIGGRNKYYSFNHDELTDAANFAEGNGSVLMKDLHAQGQAIVDGHATINGVLSLEASNSTHIPDVQLAINKLIAAGKMTVATADGSPVRFTSGILYFSANIVVAFRDQSTTNTVLSSGSPITLADGNSIYLNLNPTQSQNIPAIVIATLPKTQQAFRLCTRVGSYLVWFNGAVQRDNDLVRIGGAVDFRDQILSMLCDGGIVSHSSTTAGLIAWDATIHVRPLGSSAEISIAPGSVAMNDGDVAYISLDDPMTTATKTMTTSPRTLADLSRVDRYWIFYRSGGKVYVRGGGTLIQGEERPIGEPISNDIFTFMGSQGETDTAPQYTTHGHLVASTANRHVTDGESLTSGIKSLDTSLAAHEDADTNVHGVGAGNQVVGTGTAQVITNKDIDGGTATNTDRITVPKNTAPALLALTRKEGTIVYDTDSHKMFYDDGTDLKPVGSGGSVGIDAYDYNTLTLPSTTAYLVDGQTIVSGMLVMFDKLTAGAHKAYKATVAGSAVTWVAQSLFSNGSTPLVGEEIRVRTGTSFALQLGVFDGSVFRFNNKVRFFNGLDYYEQSAIVGVAIAASTTAPVFTIGLTGSENIVADFSILRGSAKEVGTLHITTDGTTAVVAQSGVVIGLTGINFAANVVSGNLVLSYISDASGTGTLKIIVRRWANASGGPAGLPSYGASSGSSTAAAGSNGQIQFNSGGTLAADSGLSYDQTLKALTLAGVQTVGLVSMTLADNTGTPAAVMTYDWATYPFVIVEYSVKRDSNYRVGRFMITSNGTVVSMTDDNALVGDTGITFLATISGTNIVVQYLSTSTGISGVMKYSIKRWQ